MPYMAKGVWDEKKGVVRYRLDTQNVGSGRAIEGGQCTPGLEQAKVHPELREWSPDSC